MELYLPAKTPRGRICSTMEIVIVPLRGELEEEVKLAEAA